jgi:uncharacterized protein involved in exopolysaccharide biosynthesis
MPQYHHVESGEFDQTIESRGGTSWSAQVGRGFVVPVLKAGWRQGSTVALSMFFIMAVFAFSRPNVYTAKASFLPPSGGSKMGALASELSLLGGGTGILPQKSSGDTYIGLLGSRTLADKLIARFHLMDVYKVRKQSVAESILAARSNFELGVRDGIITVKVTDRNAERAKDLANAYLDELHSLNGELAITEAAQRRLFFEQQLQKEKNNLADAEVALRQVQERTGLIAPLGQTQVEVQAITQMRAAISSREATLAGLRASATDQNRAVVRLRNEIANLQRQLTSLQAGVETSGPAGVAQTKVPQAEMEYVRRERDVKYHEALFEALAKQYESARLDESHDAPVLQVVDYAIVPDTKSGPPRVLLLGTGLVLGVLLGATYTLLRDRSWMQEAGPQSSDGQIG